MVGVAALLIALAVAGSWLLVRPRTAEPAPPLDLPAELVAPHNLFARDETLLEARGDPSTVGAWLSTRVGFRVSVPALADFDLAGGRLVTVDGRPAAQLVYEREATHEYVSLLYFNTGRDGLPGLHPTDGFAVGQQGDVTVVAWTGTGPDTALIAARPATDLLRLATDLAGRR